MDVINPVPTLSTDGWVTSQTQRLDYLFVYFFESDFLQSTVYAGNVSSLQWILKENPRNMTAAAEAVRTTLITYFQAYYDSATVEVSVTDTDPTVSSAKSTMTIYVSVVQNGITYNAAQVLTIVDGKMTEFAAINNA